MPVMPTKVIKTRFGSAHNQFYSELLELHAKYTGELDSSETLALAAYAVGCLIALQDQTKMTPESAMATVAANIELGNKATIESYKPPLNS